MPNAVNVVGLRFKRAGRLFYFDAGELDLQVNDMVETEIEGRQKVGWVVIAPKQVVHSEAPGPLNPVLRKIPP